MDFNNNGKLDAFDLLVMEHILNEEDKENEEDEELENEEGETIEQKEEYIKNKL